MRAQLSRNPFERVARAAVPRKTGRRSCVGNSGSPIAEERSNEGVVDTAVTRRHAAVRKVP